MEDRTKPNPQYVTCDYEASITTMISDDEWKRLGLQHLLEARKMTEERVKKMGPPGVKCEIVDPVWRGDMLYCRIRQCKP